MSLVQNAAETYPGNYEPRHFIHLEAEVAGMREKIPLGVSDLVSCYSSAFYSHSTFHSSLSSPALTLRMCRIAAARGMVTNRLATVLHASSLQDTLLTPTINHLIDPSHQICFSLADSVTQGSQFFMFNHVVEGVTWSELN